MPSDYFSEVITWAQLGVQGRLALVLKWPLISKVLVCGYDSSDSYTNARQEAFGFYKCDGKDYSFSERTVSWTLPFQTLMATFPVLHHVRCLFVFFLFRHSYYVTGWWTLVRITAGERDLYLFRNVETRPGAHPPSYSMDNTGSSPGITVAGA